MDFSNVKIRCSSLGSLFTEPVSKADKDAGNLSKTAKSHLIEVYARELWGVERDIVTKQMKKGIQAEESALTLLSRIDKKLYTKNEEHKSNDWIQGTADIVDDDLIVDNKCSWDAFSFLPKLIEPIDKDNYYQLVGYMWLWEKNNGRISHTLVDTPQNIIDGELYRLLRSMDVATEENIEYKKAAEKLISNMKFDHLPMEQRVINYFVTRDEQFEETIAKIPVKVEKAREFLQELHKKHLSLYPKA